MIELLIDRLIESGLRLGILDFKINFISFLRHELDTLNNINNCVVHRVG